MSRPGDWESSAPDREDGSKNPEIGFRHLRNFEETTVLESK